MTANHWRRAKTTLTDVPKRQHITIFPQSGLETGVEVIVIRRIVGHSLVFYMFEVLEHI